MNIEPIKLLAGTYADTATTGHGCFMNVIAYLNGEPQITDQSPCVCRMVRPLAIALNDRATDAQRQRLLPFVLRAMGSATDDKSVIESRLRRMRQYGAECQEAVNAWRAEMKAAAPYADANGYADAYPYGADADAADADPYADAVAYSDAYSDAYADAKRDELHETLFAAGLRYLDDVLPPLEAPSGVVMERAAKLLALQA